MLNAKFQASSYYLSELLQENQQGGGGGVNLPYPTEINVN